MENVVVEEAKAVEEYDGGGSRELWNLGAVRRTGALEFLEAVAILEREWKAKESGFGWSLWFGKLNLTLTRYL